MTLAKSNSVLKGFRTVQQALVWIGISRKVIYKREFPERVLTFWKRSPYYLLDVLKQAKALYLSKIKLYHPDKKGSHKAAATLNCVWGWIKTLFKRHGIEL